MEKARTLALRLLSAVAIVLPLLFSEPSITNAEEQRPCPIIAQRWGSITVGNKTEHNAYFTLSGSRSELGITGASVIGATSKVINAIDWWNTDPRAALVRTRAGLVESVRNWKVYDTSSPPEPPIAANEYRVDIPERLVTKDWWGWVLGAPEPPLPFGNASALDALSLQCTFSTPSASQGDGSEGVWLYQHADFGGRAQKFASDTSSLLGSTIGNDQASSIKIVGPYTVTAYRNINFAGGSKEWSASASFVGWDWNDVISSLKVHRIQSAAVTPPSSQAVSTCTGATKSWSELDSELSLARYPGPFDHGQQELGAYNRAACPSTGPPTRPPTSAQPGVPNLYDPQDGLSVQVGQTISFSWSNTGASQYKFEAWNDSVPGSGQWLSVSGSSYSFAPATAGSWRWQVRSILNNGEPGDAPYARGLSVSLGPTQPQPAPQPTSTPRPQAALALDLSPGSASVGDSVSVRARTSDSSYNTIRVTLGCGSPSEYELGAPEVNFTWNTSGCSAGTRTVTAQARAGGDWSGAISTSRSYTLSQQVYPPPSVDFVAENSTSGRAPLTVRFSDRNASAGISSWLWNFGDGTTSTQSGAINHTYSTQGTYTVSLTVSGQGGSYTATKPNMVTVSPPLDGRLVGSWDFDEGSGSTSSDLSGYGNIAQLASANWTTGIRGKAVHFAGERGAGVKIGGSSSLESNTFTFAASVRPSGSPEVSPIASQGASNNARERWALNQRSDRLELQVWSSGGGSSVQSDGGMLTVGQWNNVTVSYDGLNVKFYKDGGLRSTKTLSVGGINSVVYDLYLGSVMGNVWNQESWRGDIDEVRYYNSVVNP